MMLKFISADGLTLMEDMPGLVHPQPLYMRAIMSSKSYAPVHPMSQVTVASIREYELEKVEPYFQTQLATYREKI